MERDVSNLLWYKGAIELGTIVYGHEGGLVVARGISEKSIEVICHEHNNVVMSLIGKKG